MGVQGAGGLTGAARRPGIRANGEFPEGFLWGVSTSSHQIEGGNANNDWWAWEHQPGSGCVEPSGDACDSRHRWREDISLVSGLGLSAYRFSLEWSRIEPAEGEFSRAELEFYRRMCAACREDGILPMVTFNHYTMPLWLSRRGGWEAPDAGDRFVRFVARASDAFGDLIGLAVTLNEPNVMAVMGYTKGEFPPGVKDLGRHLAVNETLARAHLMAVDALRSGPGDYGVGMGLSMAEIHADPGGEAARDAAEEILENSFLRASTGDDFIGVQSYSRFHLGPEGEAPDDPDVPKTQMGYEYWPQVVEYTVRRAASVTGLPVVVTESGIGTEDDAERIRYLDEALRGLHRCIEDGIDVRGYFVWTLLDNFEWTHGYRPKFGLHTVDRTTFAREQKPSARWYAEVVKANTLPAAPG
jgi:beta-glucosidase